MWKQDIPPNLRQTSLFDFQHNNHPQAGAMKP